jgi:transmembrane sensor
MSDHTPWPLIAKFLAGECSPEEKRTMEWWLEDPQNELIFQQIRKAWLNEPENGMEFNAENGLSRLHARISKTEPSYDDPVSKKWNYFKISSWMAAACVAFLIGFGYMLVNRSNSIKKQTRIASTENVSSKDQIRRFVLPDGSIVWLNKNSRIAFKKAFSAEQREVFLEGEAFFEVVPNPAKPFIVKSSKVSTKVLGTSFNVKAYRKDATASVAVATGKVEVSKEIREGMPIRITQLTPQQKLVINTEKDETFIDIVSLWDVGSWRNSGLVFRNNTYTDVIARLEEHYGIKVTLTDNAIKDCRVMASFNENAALEDVLKLLSISNSFRYNMEGKQVTITGGVCR